MQNKGAVKLFAIALALVCIYQLSFTWFASRVESKAKGYAKNDLNREQAYLDSVKTKVVIISCLVYKSLLTWIVRNAK